MRRLRFLAAACIIAFLGSEQLYGAEKADIRTLDRIWGTAEHSAFTDLINHLGEWFCVFREGEGHVYGRDGQIRVIHSTDGESWKSAAVLREDGVDLRDPKISLAPDGRLMIVMGGSVYDGRTLVTRQSRVAFSADGRSWTAPQKVLSPGEWLWRVTWRGDEGYGTAYGSAAEGEWSLRLYRTRNGTDYEFIAPLEIGGRPNETTLRFASDGRMIAFVRREGGDAVAWIGSSLPPYTEWKWHLTQHRVGGPNFVILPDGRMWAAGRSYPGGAKTAMGRMTETGYEPILTLPSGGDTSYPGLVWHEGLLWMSYYSSHEGKAAIYLAKISLPAD